MLTLRLKGLIIITDLCFGFERIRGFLFIFSLFRSKLKYMLKTNMLIVILTARAIYHN